MRLARRMLGMLLMLSLAACGSFAARPTPTPSSVPSAAVLSGTATAVAPAALPTDAATAEVVPAAPAAPAQSQATAEPSAPPAALPTDAATAEVVPVAPTPAAPAPSGPAARSIIIDTPVDGAVVRNPVELRGRVTVLPFENNLVYRIYDQGNTLLQEGAVTVDGGTGQGGTFAVPISISAAPSGGLRLEVVDIDQADGQVLARAAAAITLAPALPTRSITLDAPAEGAIVSSPVELRGRVTVLPFENNLTYRVFAADNTSIGSGAITVVAAADGSGTFAVPIAINAAAGSTVRIEVQDVNVADGSLFAAAQVRVTLR